jgi:hypothetical protein
MAKTGLLLRPTDCSTIEQIGRRQPDWLLISEECKRIAIPDLCRPSDVFLPQLQAAAQRKQQAYSPLEEALSYYTEQGWIVHVFPWVVGIRGMLDPAHVESLLKFIGIQQKHWKVAAERSVLASVRAFHFLHKVRFGGLSYATRSDLNSDHSDCEQDDSKDGEVAKRKSSESRVSLTLGNTDADSSADSDAEPRSTHRSPPKVRRTLPTREANAWAGGDQSPSAGAAPTGQSPCPAPNSSDPLPPKAAARNRTRWKRPYKRHSRATRPTASVMHMTAQTPSTNTCSRASRKPFPKRKRWERTNTLDSDQSPQQCAVDDHPEALWKRWRQMEPRRGRRT